MKLKLRKLILSVILVVCIFVICSYLHVSGGEIEHVSDINEYCTVTITEYQHMGWAHRTEYVLDSDGIEELRALLLDGSFTRTFGSYVIFDDNDQYHITIDFNDNERYLSITVLGNEYMLVTDQFNGKHLKINTKTFEKCLQEIILNK